jgi:hypothetical protein
VDLNETHPNIQWSDVSYVWFTDWTDDVWKSETAGASGNVEKCTKTCNNYV